MADVGDSPREASGSVRKGSIGKASSRKVTGAKVPSKKVAAKAPSKKAVAAGDSQEGFGNLTQRGKLAAMKVAGSRDQVFVSKAGTRLDESRLAELAAEAEAGLPVDRLVARSRKGSAAHRGKSE
jgi:hypothetical protein